MEWKIDLDTAPMIYPLVMSIENGLVEIVSFPIKDGDVP